MKDQGDAAGMPTTLGSVLFKDYYPDRDAFVVDKLKKAGAIILAKATLGELGGGDTHGSLFGSTKNPYDLERTVGGSSGGSGASVSANFCTVAVGQEGFASIRRPSTWNCVVGMRPTAGSGESLRCLTPAGPRLTARSVRWRARLPTWRNCWTSWSATIPTILSPHTASAGFAESFTAFLDKQGLHGARLGILRESMGYDAEPGSEDFNKIVRGLR